jgi:hypothetical protein
MKTKVLFVTASLTACLVVAAMAAQKSSTAPDSKAAGSSASKAAAPMHHSSMTSSVTATVVSVDQATRKVTLKGENGSEYTFTADPSVKNLAQVKAGDMVTATYTESVGYVVKKGEGAAAMSSSEGTTTAPAGEKPASMTTSKTTVSVVITAIDTAAPSVSFKGPNGSVHTVKVEDPEKLTDVKVGDTVDITYTEALSLKVHAANSAAATGKKK